jgi:hypothetical protein
MQKFFKIFGIVLITIIAVVSIFIFRNLHNRHSGYRININIKHSQENNLRVGFSAVTITPVIPDTWHDVNGDAQYNPEDGDTFTDGNGNGKFDPVWMAGFQNRRAANGIHDNLWARTLVIDDGTSRISITVLDAIGFMYDEVIDVRQRIEPDMGITYSLFASTHTHEAPDLQGLWGEGFLKSGINPEYLSFIKDQCYESIKQAVASMQPAFMIFAEEKDKLSHLVTDTRKPEVTDHGLRLILAINPETGHAIGTLIAWANHPETLWNKNLLITSDFPHYVREAVEKGIYSNDSLVIEGLGGTAIYINGAIGGLMTTPPEMTVRDPFTSSKYKEPSFEKAQAQGHQVARVVLETLNNSTDTLKRGNINLTARTVELPLTNKIFQLGVSLGILERSVSGWMNLQTELSFFTLGPASFVTMPGEIYPELINGGIESPEGADYGIAPLEVPPVRELMPGKYKFIFGLTNDAIGYIIPKSEWDVKEPYLYDEEESPYGEINSVGHDTAPLLYGSLKKMILPVNGNK